MSTILSELKRHVKMARAVADSWEKSGPPRAGTDDNLRVVTEEIAFLESLKIAHPGRVANLEKLAERYRKLRRALHESAHDGSSPVSNSKPADLFK